MNATNQTLCNCKNCPGQSCTCGCQAPRAQEAAPKSGCACGPQCQCGPGCACKRG